MNLEWRCHKCFNYFPQEIHHYNNSYKMFNLCEKCFNDLKIINEKLIEGYVLIEYPTQSDTCKCDCCNH